MSDGDTKRLIEVAFPLKQASLDSVHEKNVRHGHISTLHIWPARRPLAACRAALIATLLPDPGDPKKRQELCEKIGGKVVEVVKKKKLPSGKIEEKVVEETVGGILHWGRESDPPIDFFRDEIRKAYGGRAPKVLDPFAGGGAIPLEAMRLGCEATAIDINPVAWFILKCTLEYPQKLAGQVRPLPKFALESPEFMEQFFKKTSKLTKKQLERNLQAAQMELFPAPDVDLSWHVRAWGWWVLQQARKELAEFYPTYADYEPLDRSSSVEYEKRESQRVPLNDDRAPNIDILNADLDPSYVDYPAKPRWIAKPTVAYLWARTVTCKNCRATIPLLKTRWLCKKANKRVLLTMKPSENRTSVTFGVQNDVPVVGGNAAQRREHDKRIGAGTMSRAGAWCPCCGKAGTVAMKVEDIRQEGKAGRLGTMMTAVVVDGPKGKEYRLPMQEEIQRAEKAGEDLDGVFETIPFGLPKEPLPPKEALGFRVPLYGFDRWGKLFTPRQLLAMGIFVKHTRAAREVLRTADYSSDWEEAIVALLALVLDKVADYNSMVCVWHLSRELIGHTFTRFALPITWDFTELAVVNEVGGAFLAQLDWVARFTEHALIAGTSAEQASIINESAIQSRTDVYDVVVTDPPYYDAIPYSDLMDFFYLWLRRTLNGLSDVTDSAFGNTLGPKWDHDSNDGELIDDASRHEGDSDRSKSVYEDGMTRAFQACHSALTPSGRLVVVFANKQPDAWEALVSGLIRAGFVVDGSWPIQTEMATRMRAKTSAALASSVWLVCKKRPDAARPGWDNRVLQEMRERIQDRLRDFWDAGIRGPDFVWAATGPALEAYSKHPVVKKANKPNELMTVSEFLGHVRRMVVDFVVGQVLTHGEGAEAVEGLDDITTYYLLHRNDFGMNEAPSGACIMYALSCGLSDRALADQYDILASGKRRQAAAAEEGEEEGPDDDEGSGSGSTAKLVPWNRRKKKSLGYEAPGGRPVPLIDQVHRLMHLWKSGDVVKVDEYLVERGLRNNRLFHQVLQALIELADTKNGERSMLESISNHIAGRGAVYDRQMKILTTDYADDTDDGQ